MYKNHESILRGVTSTFFINYCVLYFKYGIENTFFLSADASRNGSPLTNNSKNVVHRGPMIVHRGTSYAKQKMKIPNHSKIFPK